MDIREFYKSQQKNQTSNTSTNFENSSPNSSPDFSDYQETINKYKDLSQEDLYSELLNQASNLKSQGKLDEQTLQQISSTLSPMLNDEQKDLLNNIIERLK